jgi:hypothetical protein
MEMMQSCETSFHILTTRRYILGDGNIFDCRCDNLKSYALNSCTASSYVVFETTNFAILSAELT